MFGRVQMLIASASILFLSVFLQGCDQSPPPTKLEVAKAKSESCVEPTDIMRKNHMDFIVHQRDETVYGGIRTSKHSFKACINCHVPAEENGKPVNYLSDDHKLNPDHFCATCHAYVGVKLDCFECHSDNPAGAAPTDQVHAGAVKGPGPAKASVQGGTQ